MMRRPDVMTSYAETTAPTVLIVAEAGAAVEALAAVDLVGARLIDQVAWDALPAAIDRYAARAVLLIEAERADDAAIEAALPVLAECVEQRDLQIVVALATPQIDLVSAHLFGSGVQLLCAPTVADRIAALAVAISASEAMVLHDTWRESEASRLHRLNEEVARIAEILSQLARGDLTRDTDREIADRRRGYDAGPGMHGEIDAQAVRRLIRARRLRDQFFGEGLFEEPAWDMLLDLYAAELEHTRVSVSSLCIAAAVAPTTALRWIAKLTENGMMVRQPDPIDRRRAFIALAPSASSAMRGYMAALHRSEAKHVG